MKKAAIWLYLYEKRKWVYIKKDNSRLDWNYLATPTGTVKYDYDHRGNKYSYCEYGETQEEVCEKYNEFVNEKIEKLKQEIIQLEEKLLKPE